jgi:hypothetical protein
MRWRTHEQRQAAPARIGIGALPRLMAALAKRRAAPPWHQFVSAFAQVISRSRVRRRATAWPCSWHTRYSLTSITAPISRRFMPRS